MRNLLLFALLLLSASCARVHYTPKTDRRNDNLNGEVSILREYFYAQFRQDNVTAGIYDSTVIYYNRAGNITEQSVAEHRKGGVDREIFVYSDSSGLLVGRNTLHIGGGFLEITNYYYNSDGTLAEERIRTGAGETVHRFTHDERGFPVRIAQDAAGYVNRIDSTRAARILSFADSMVIVNRYDRQGRLVRTTEIWEMKNVRQSTLSEINYHYRRGVLHKVYYSNGLQERYNERGDVIRSVNMNLMNLKNRANKKLMKSLTYYIDYMYDEYGNWTYRYVRYSNEPVSITLRKNEYY